MRVEVISVGTELLHCRLSDTNACFLIRELRKLGFAVRSLTLVGDDESDLEAVFNGALTRSDIIITTGGLGSGHDDLTKRYVAKVFNHKLILSNEVLDTIKKKFEQHQIEMPTNVQKHALLPRKSVMIPNVHGTAPGFMVQENEKVFICLPGVPKEMEQMWTDTVKSFLEDRSKGIIKKTSLFARTCGLSRTEVEGLLGPYFEQSDLTWGLTVKEEGVDIEFFIDTIRAVSSEYEEIKLKKDIEEILGSSLYGWGETNMEEIVGKLLVEQGCTLAVAESCTGGLLAHRLTQVAGSSRYFERGIVSYSNRSKEALLEVKSSTLQEHGAVSSHVALEMAMGIRKLAETDFGLSITGIAGPEGGTNEKPVGLAYCGFASRKEYSSHSFRVMGNREAIKMQFSQAALNILRLYLEERKIR